MKKLLTLLCVFSFTELTFADDHVNGTWVAAEYYFCNFNEGQDMDDLKRVAAEFNRFLDKYRDVGDYDAVLLVETYDQDRDFDYIWSGHWPSIADMANGTQNWIDNGTALQAKFDKVSKCDGIRGYQYIYANSAPDGDAWPVDYSYCKLNDGKESMDAIKLMDKIAETTKADGAKGGGRLFFRTHGSTNQAPYDFVLVDSPGSFANEAVNWQLARENDWWGQFGEEFEATMECSDDAVRYIGTYLTDPLAQ